MGWLLGLIVLVIDLYAIVQTVGSGASSAAKLVWILVILVLPVLGAIAWLVAGPRGGRARI